MHQNASSLATAHRRLGESRHKAALMALRPRRGTLRRVAAAAAGRDKQVSSYTAPAAIRKE